MTPRQEKLLTEKVIRPMVKKMLRESFRTTIPKDGKFETFVLDRRGNSISIFQKSTDAHSLIELSEHQANKLYEWLKNIYEPK